jgi:diguanylate cyclase (GGDEF)-like protein
MGLLLAVVIAGGVRSWTVERKVRQETAALAYLEQRRSRILEEINASCPLSEIIKQITEVVSFKLHGAASWCEITGGACIGNKPSKFTSQKVVQQEIPGRSGNALGTIYAAVVSLAKPGPSEQAALALGAELARLAIESSQLYSDLVHRSEFDLLTDVQNRFAMEKTLETLIQAARQSAGIFGLIYLDLNEFKQVNDQYGHQVGDLYLQEAALRMKRQLRPGDMLARLGGDEFAVLVSEVRNRAEVEEIALRLERCFDEPFAVEGHLVHGSSSVGIALYPEDAATRDGLLSKADAAMYAVKQSRQDGSEGQAGSLASELAS